MYTITEKYSGIYPEQRLMPAASWRLTELLVVPVARLAVVQSSFTRTSRSERFVMNITDDQVPIELLLML